MTSFICRACYHKCKASEVELIEDEIIEIVNGQIIINNTKCATMEIKTDFKEVKQ